MVVVADDDLDLLSAMEFHLEQWGIEAHGAECRKDLDAILAKLQPDVLVLDLHFGADRGLDVLAELMGRRFLPPVIILTAHGSIETAVQAIKLGRTTT